MRTKRYMRDKLYTQAFFGQSPACTCAHTHGSDQAPCNLKTRAGTTYAEISREISAATKALEAATRGIDSACTANERFGPEVVDQSQEIDTFELKELEQCVGHYDGVLEEFGSIEEDIIGSISDEVDATGDDKQDVTKAVEATVKRIHLKQARVNALVDSCLCSVQFFNVDKKFNFMMEAFEEIARQHEARNGVDSPPLPPPTLTQKFNDPVKLLVDEATERKEPRPRKRLGMEAAMLSTKRLCMLAIKDIQAVNKSISDENRPPVVTNNTAIPRNRKAADIPEDIRQALCNFEFAYDEIIDLREKTTKLRDHIRCTMMIWVSTSKDAWEYGKTHIHEFPDMRYYEYLRNSLRALYTVWLRDEAKILRYCKEQGGPESLGLSPKLEEALQIRTQTLEGFEREWEASTEQLKTFLSSVDDMMKQLEAVDKDLNPTNERGDYWWKFFMPEHMT